MLMFLILVSGWVDAKYVAIADLQFAVDVWLVSQLLTDSKASDDSSNLQCGLLVCPVLREDADEGIISKNCSCNTFRAIFSSKEPDKEDTQIFWKFSIFHSFDQFFQSFISVRPSDEKHPFSSDDAIFFCQSRQGLFIDCQISENGV